MDSASSRHHRNPHQKLYDYQKNSNPDEHLSLRHSADGDDTSNPRDRQNFPLEPRSGGGFATPARREDWDDAATAITGATSEFAYSFYEEDQELPSSFRLARYSGPFISAVIAILAFISPIVMVVFPKLGIGSWNIEDCGPSCEAVLIGLGFRLVLLIAASCALYLRSLRSTMPRIFVFRALVVFLIFVLTFTFWLFYVVRVYFFLRSRLGEVRRGGTVCNIACRCSDLCSLPCRYTD